MSNILWKTPIDAWLVQEQLQEVKPAEVETSEGEGEGDLTPLHVLFQDRNRYAEQRLQQIANLHRKVFVS